MEATGLEIGREETKQRRALNKAFLQAIKNRAQLSQPLRIESGSAERLVSRPSHARAALCRCQYT